MGREANACCMICEKTFSSLEAAERCENRHKEKKPKEGRLLPKQVALRIYFPKYGQETTSKILCPSHRVSMMALAPASYGTGEEFPLDACEACMYVTLNQTTPKGD